MGRRRPKRTARLLPLACLLGMVLVSLSALPSKAAFPGANGKIAFVKGRTSGQSIFTMNGDGTDQAALSGSSTTPAWSPDGQRIAFTTTTSCDLTIFVMSGLAVMNADGTGMETFCDGSSPTWSPDGQKIAFSSSSRHGNSEIYAMNADGTDTTRLTDNPASDTEPAWSPDGQKIAFESNRDGNPEIYVMNADGSNQVNLTGDPAADTAPSWAPDGDLIAFSSNRAGNPDVHLVTGDGTGTTRLTDSPASDTGPAWSPDGQKIAFESNRDGNPEIYVMNADGSSQTNLTNDPGENDFAPDWQPVPGDPQPESFTVTSTVDPGDGVCDADCTLREAIEAANDAAGTNTIAFDIPGPAPHRIQPSTVLPVLTEPVVVDGTTQPGYSETPIVEVNGGLLAGAPAGNNGITVDGGSTVRGLSVTGFPDTGIRVEGGSGTIVAGNWAGLTPAGAASGNAVGIRVIHSQDSTVGGTTAADRNVVSGNQVGIAIEDSSIGSVTRGNRVVGNYVGTNPAGTAAIGNTSHGIVLQDAFDNVIGGATAAERNVIAGSNRGITVANSQTTGNLIQGNFIGTNKDGTGALPNNTGVSFFFAPPSNTLGGTDTGAGNLIAFNGRDGVLVEKTSGGQRILGNSIHSNLEQGIDLVASASATVPSGDGVTANDDGDGDAGGNDLQNFPVLTSATSGIGTTVAGTLNSAAGTTYRLEFFESPACDTPGGNGEGRTYLGSAEVTTDGSGDASFTADLGTAASVGAVVTATATDPIGSTSEFSACLTVSQGDAATFTVNSTADTDDGACTVANCTLREAINRANSLPGTDTISFAITGDPPHAIRPTTPLPTITSPAVVDGTTNPDFESCADGPVIELDGSNATGSRDGFTITAGSSTVRGFVINRFSFPGRAIHMEGAGGNTIECNFIGTNAAGTAAAGNWVGVSMTSSPGNTIGGTNPNARNVISGNTEVGVRVNFTGSTGTVVQGNYIGTNAAGDAALGAALGQNAIGVFLNGTSNATIGGAAPGARNVISGNGGVGVAMNSTGSVVRGNYVGVSADGTHAVGNGGDGILLGDSTINNVVGGTTPEARNVISGNDGFGIFVNGAGGAAFGNLVQGNSIGTNAAGNGLLGNADGGIGMVQASFGSRRQTIGGTAAGAGNVIAGNDGPGISISGASSAPNTILGNSIHSNAGLGIDLGNDGVTANDAGDADSGPNGLQNFPVFTSARPGSTVVEGTLSSAASTTYRIELFANAECDASGNGEAETLLGFENVTTGSDGTASFSVTLDAETPVGSAITATATDQAGNTSELSACVSVAEPAGSHPWGWGENYYGQLGNGGGMARETPRQVEGLSGVTAVAAGAYHSLALRSDGTVRALGANWYGQLGDGTTTERRAPVAVSGLGQVVAISAGCSHSLALKEDGTVWAWGGNWSGQLGDGTTTSSATPVQVSGLSDVTTVAGGSYHSLALKQDGTAWAWGNNWYGQLGDGTTTSRTEPVQVSELAGATALAAGYLTSHAARFDGTVWSWGYNGEGQLGDGTTTSRAEPVQVSGLSGVTTVAGGFYHSLALRSDGTAWAWGANWYGQLGDGTTTSSRTPVQTSGLGSIVAAAAGGYHSVASKEDGTVWAWGGNWSGQLGDGSTTQRLTPVQVSGLTGAIAISAGCSHSLALKADGTVWAWGGNWYGQLGEGTTNSSATPVQVSGLTDVVAVSAGESHSLAVKADGTVWAWGANWYGQLGDGTTTPSATPVQVSALSGATAISAGSAHSLALTEDGTAWAWGNNWYGQLGDGTTTEQHGPVQVVGFAGVTTIDAGGVYSMAVAGGSAWAWGASYSYVLGSGGGWGNRTTPARVLGLQGVSAVSAGYTHSVALAASTLLPIGRTSSGAVEPGGTFTSDPEGQGATQDNPVVTSITSPVAGEISIEEAPSAEVSASGYTLFGRHVQITAPSSTAESPLVITFRIDASQLPWWWTPSYLQSLTVFRNGTPVASCTGAAEVASPDPCVSSRTLLEDGDVEITVLTSEASLWSFGLPAPVATAQGPYTVQEGSSVQLDGSGSSGTGLRYAWSAAGGLDDPTIATPTYTGVDDAVETLTLQVADTNGQTTTDTTTVTVTNVAPSVTIETPSSGASFTVGSGPSLSASFTDPGTLDTHTCSIDWGDGTTTSPAVSGHTCSQAHAYSAPGSFTITVTITDDDGGVGTDSVDVVVASGFASMDFHYHWSGDKKFPNSPAYGASTPATVKKDVAYSYRIHALVTNDTGGPITVKLQGGLTGAKGATSKVVSTTCGKAAIKTGKTEHVVVWNASGDGNPASPGFAMAPGKVCSLEVQIDKLAFGSTGLKAITGEWTETQTGPGSFSGKSPPTGTLNVNVVP